VRHSLSVGAALLIFVKFYAFLFLSLFLICVFLSFLPALVRFNSVQRRRFDVKLTERVGSNGVYQLPAKNELFCSQYQFVLVGSVCSGFPPSGFDLLFEGFSCEGVSLKTLISDFFFPSAMCRTRFRFCLSFCEFWLWCVAVFVVLVQSALFLVLCGFCRSSLRV
jgi:hypothetical protein